MGIVFFCQSCGARFEVPDRMAGKKGRCKKCGQYMPVPKAEQLASMAAMPALAWPAAGCCGGGGLAVPEAACSRSAGEAERLPPASSRWATGST